MEIQNTRTILSSKICESIQSQDTGTNMEAVSHHNLALDQEVSVTRQVPLVKEYNTKWKRRARNISTYVFEQSSQMVSLEGKSLVDDTTLDEPLLTSKSDAMQIPKKSKTLEMAENQPYLGK